MHIEKVRCLEASSFAELRIPEVPEGAVLQGTNHLVVQGGKLKHSNSEGAFVSIPSEDTSITWTENFDGDPVFQIKGNSSLQASWLGAEHGNALVTPKASLNGNFQIYFSVPAGMTGEASADIRADYPNSLVLRRKVNGVWTHLMRWVDSDTGSAGIRINIPDMVPGEYMFASQTPNGDTACTYTWCANGKTYIDNLQVRHIPDA